MLDFVIEIIFFFLFIWIWWQTWGNWNCGWPGGNPTTIRWFFWCDAGNWPLIFGWHLYWRKWSIIFELDSLSDRKNPENYQINIPVCNISIGCIIDIWIVIVINGNLHLIWRWIDWKIKTLSLASTNYNSFSTQIFVR